MSCDTVRRDPDGYIPIHLRAWRQNDKPPPVIALLHKASNIFVVPVRWRHLAQECDAWTFDALTWRLDVATRNVTIAHFHRRPNKGLKGPGVIYRIAVSVFNGIAHSSYSCNDQQMLESERLHCPRSAFVFDRDQEDQPNFDELQPAFL